LMMIRKMKEVLTWVWIVVIGAAICLNVCAQTPQDWVMCRNRSHH
jgi:hypothetical protein